MSTSSAIGVVIKEIFNKFAANYCEPINDNKVDLDYNNGFRLEGLKLKPDAVNEIFESSEADIRVVRGEVGNLGLIYNPVPGTISVKLDQIEIIVQPNTMKSLARVIKSGVSDLLRSPEDIPQYNRNSTMPWFFGLNKPHIPCCDLGPPPPPSPRSRNYAPRTLYDSRRGCHISRPPYQSNAYEAPPRSYTTRDQIPPAYRYTPTQYSYERQPNPPYFQVRNPSCGQSPPSYESRRIIQRQTPTYSYSHETHEATNNASTFSRPRAVDKPQVPAAVTSLHREEFVNSQATPMTLDANPTDHPTAVDYFATAQ